MNATTESVKDTEKIDIDLLASQYGDSLLRLCFLYLKDFHLAQDAVQETFIKSYYKASSFRNESNIQTWLVRIAINVCKNYLRNSWWKKNDGEQALQTLKLNDAPNIDDTLIKSILSLSAKYREVILLRYYQEMKVKDIAKVLKISESAVSVRLNRAREILKHKLEGWYYDE